MSACQFITHVFLLLFRLEIFHNKRVFFKFYIVFKNPLVQLSRLSAALRTGRCLVGFPSRAHAWVSGQVPTWGCARGN